MGSDSSRSSSSRDGGGGDCNSFLCTWHYVKLFTWVIPFNPHKLHEEDIIFAHCTDEEMSVHL